MVEKKKSLGDYSLDNPENGLLKVKGKAGRKDRKERGVEYVSIAPQIKASTKKLLAQALAGDFYGKTQNQIVDEAIVYYIENYANN